MRIGIYDPYLDDLGGGEKYMMTIAECLLGKHKVDVFWDTPKDLDTLTQRFGLDLDGVYLAQNIFAPGYNPLKRLQATKNYDAILVLSDGSIPVSLSKKLFIHVQQPLAEFQGKSWKDKWKISRVDAFFCNSKFTESFIDKKLYPKTIIIYPPVELHSQNVKKENMIVHVGRFRVKNVKLDDYKKQGVMVGVFKKMVDNGLTNWKFVVATSVQPKDEESFDEMKKQAVGYPIEFVVNSSNRKLWDVYNKAKIYWHASGFGENLIKYPEFAEHFGISTVEAMGAGVVPVVINAGGQTEIVTDGENGFLWDTLDQLAEKTLRVIQNDQIRKRLAASAKDRAKNFSKEEFSQDIYELIEA